MSLFKLIRSDFLKMKNTSFYIIHICLPLLGAFIFLFYYSVRKANVNVEIRSYLEVLSIVFPLLISIVTSQAIKKEKVAGNYKEVLGNQYGRILCVTSKFSMLLICGFISLLIAISVFACGMEYVLKQTSLVLRFTFYIKAALLIFGCQIIIYIFHIALNFRFNNGMSMLIGTFESLLTALMMTGLGDGIWQWIPSGISIRLNESFTLKNISSALINELNYNINLGVRNLIIFTIIFGIIFIYWFNNYDVITED